MHGPFAPEEDPRRFEDAMYRDPPFGTAAMKEIVRGLLHVDMNGRMSAADALELINRM